MNIEEIRKKAPEGATHYIILSNGSVEYFKKDGFEWFDYWDYYGGWRGNIEMVEIIWFFGWWWQSKVTRRYKKLKPLYPCCLFKKVAK